MRYVPNPDWREGLYALTDELFLTRLGPEISSDAKRYCPVFFGENSTAGDVSYQIAVSLGTPMPGGALRDSIEFHLRGHVLIVRATGGNGRFYAVYVELGHHIVVFGYRTGGFKGPQSFLRRALYQTRLGA
jgi:hypothetical protein